MEYAGLTMKAPQLGVYTEPSVELVFWPSLDEDDETFTERMKDMAQEIALALAQKDVPVIFVNPDGKTEEFGASPHGFPGPDDPEFNKFVENIKQGVRR